MFSKGISTIRKNPWGDDHPEKLKSSSPPKTIGFSQQVKGLLNPDSMFSQIFSENKKRPELQNNQYKEKSPPKRNETLVFSRIKHTEEENIHKESELILKKLKQQITILEKSEKALVNEVSKIKVEQLPAKTSIYYVHFLEWLLNTVKQLRMKIEDGRAWLETFAKRKKKKLGYWKMYKKHGTTFGLSHERTIATQTG